MRLNQFFAFLYECVPNVNYFLSIHKLLENTSVRQIETGKNPSSALYSENIKPEKMKKRL